MRDRRLSVGARFLYSVLDAKAHPGDRAVGNYSKLARDYGCTRVVIAGYVAELVAAGWLVPEPRGPGQAARFRVVNPSRPTGASESRRVDGPTGVSESRTHPLRDFDAGDEHDSGGSALEIRAPVQVYEVFEVSDDANSERAGDQESPKTLCEVLSGLKPLPGFEKSKPRAREPGHAFAFEERLCQTCEEPLDKRGNCSQCGPF